ncbi:MBL fold metallo-hydrolase [Nocardioides fonticola]|uniref:MBL fold metallo-hydrolase n=1 Tax=Nocardioides fonticola TaxID=450363 RepID=A0ABP7XJ17_9ACTN
MKLTVIGCSGSYNGPDAAASCYLVEAQLDDGTGSRPWRLLVDMGSGALGELHRHIDPLSIDAVLISHLHADHCLDLCGYYVMRKYHPTGSQPRLPVWGPSTTADRMARAYDLEIDPGMHEEFEFLTWDAEVHIGPFVVEPVPVDHPVEAYGMRISADGTTIGYSGDTGPCEGLDAIAKDVDLFLAEASFRSCDTNPPALHLTGTECGEVATRMGARRLVVTHIPPWFTSDVALEEARDSFAGPVELARPGAVYDLS